MCETNDTFGMKWKFLIVNEFKERKRERRTQKEKEGWNKT